MGCDRPETGQSNTDWYALRLDVGKERKGCGDEVFESLLRTYDGC